jgi:hypothetical protein
MRILVEWLRSVVRFAVELLFGCSHSKLTRPFTIGRETYMVCLSCGKQIYYSTQEMRPMTAGEVRRMRAAQAGEVRVAPLPQGVPQLVPTGDRKANMAA